MPITQSTPPVIIFKGDSSAPISLKMAYLVRVDGKPWAYANLRDTNLDPQQVGAFPLTERLISVDPNSDPASPTYVYQGVPSVP